jgi:acetyl esterase/lipase
MAVIGEIVSVTECRRIAMTSRRALCGIIVGLALSFTPAIATAVAQDAAPAEPKRITIYDDLRYREGDSKSWTLDLALPENFGDEKHPALVIIHGGGWRNGTKRDRPYRAMLTEFALKGYVTLSVEYRLIGEAPMPACIEDVKCAIRWLRAHADKYKVDPDRIAAYGHSAGAHLALMLAMTSDNSQLEGDGPWKEHSSRITSVIGGSPPTVLSRRFSDEPEKYAPLTYVKKEMPPILLIQGTADTIVRADTTDAFVEKCKQAGFEDMTYVKIEGGDHGVAYEQAMDRSMRAMNEFLERTLKLQNSPSPTERGSG